MPFPLNVGCGHMLEAESRFVIYKTKYRGKTYDKCLINIPSNLVKDPQFPFKSEEKLKIFVDPDVKTMFLIPSWMWKELIEVAKESERLYQEVLKSIDSDPLTHTPTEGRCKTIL